MNYALEKLLADIQTDESVEHLDPPKTLVEYASGLLPSKGKKVLESVRAWRGTFDACPPAETYAVGFQKSKEWAYTSSEKVRPRNISNPTSKISGLSNRPVQGSRVDRDWYKAVCGHFTHVIMNRVKF